MEEAIQCEETPLAHSGEPTGFLIGERSSRDLLKREILFKGIFRVRPYSTRIGGVLACRIG